MEILKMILSAVCEFLEIKAANKDSDEQTAAKEAGKTARTQARQDGRTERSKIRNERRTEKYKR